MENPTDLEKIKKYLTDKLDIASKPEDLVSIKSEFLGKKGYLGKMISDMSKMPVEQKKEFGLKINILKKEIEEQIEFHENKLKEQ